MFFVASVNKEYLNVLIPNISRGAGTKLKIEEVLKVVILLKYLSLLFFRVAKIYVNLGTTIKLKVQ